MQKEIISSRHAVCIIVLFVFGSSVILGVNADVGQDSWIPLIFALVISIPVIMIYARIIKLFPEKDIFEVTVWKNWWENHHCLINMVRNSFGSNGFTEFF